MRMMPFLYFPEDKTEYIPAVITLIIFMIAASIVMYLFYKKSKKDEKKFDEQYNKKIKESKENS
ncbi:MULTISPECIES: hypothetical protein [Virgibacillus]|uniref:Uncharacterized protein n=2 Tax=Virgibacillus TaxID=84406 RepID=A0A024Q9Q0_9BACI|nr:MULTISPECIES: hypothetical protein [Virgibacillus]CDQ39224.1 hypothetical protein BN990_01510 [Virgibacillus massiliensis]